MNLATITKILMGEKQPGNIQAMCAHPTGDYKALLNDGYTQILRARMTDDSLRAVMEKDGEHVAAVVHKGTQYDLDNEQVGPIVSIEKSKNIRKKEAMKMTTVKSIRPVPNYRVGKGGMFVNDIKIIHDGQILASLDQGWFDHQPAGSMPVRVTSIEIPNLEWKKVLDLGTKNSFFIRSEIADQTGVQTLYILSPLTVSEEYTISETKYETIKGKRFILPLKGTVQTPGGPDHQVEEIVFTAITSTTPSKMMEKVNKLSELIPSANKQELTKFLETFYIIKAGADIREALDGLITSTGVLDGTSEKSNKLIIKSDNGDLTEADDDNAFVLGDCAVVDVLAVLKGKFPSKV